MHHENKAAAMRLKCKNPPLREQGAMISNRKWRAARIALAFNKRDRIAQQSIMQVARAVA